MYIEDLESELLRVVLEYMNMTLIMSLHQKIYLGLFSKEAYLALGNTGTRYLLISFLDSTNSYYMMSVHWYVPYPVKYPKWSSNFRILSVELWLFLIVSIVFAAISTKLLGRYSCTLEWQVYKTLTTSLTNIWAVILGVSVSTM
jgi:hypothetical protein